MKQLNNDIISGGMPDILVVDSNMSMDSYIAKGLVANVDDLIAGMRNYRNTTICRMSGMRTVWTVNCTM